MIDVRIMAHPSRRDNVERVLKKLALPADVVVYDDREHGGDAMYTARKAWTAPLPNGCTHRIVMQDDVEPCVGFLEIAETVAKKHTAEVVSFFHMIPCRTSSRYVRLPELSACAIMLPAKYVLPCWDRIANLPEEAQEHDDGCIFMWATENGVPIVHTIPALVQHIGDNSLVGHTGQRMAPDYTDNPTLEGW